MAVLAFLSRGDDPEFGSFSTPLKKAVRRILDQQNKDTGYLGNSMYNHGFATLALAEYYGLTNDSAIGPALKKATNLIVSAQKTNPKGAWRYSPDSKDVTPRLRGLRWLLSSLQEMRALKFPTRPFPKVKNFSSNARTQEVDSDTLEIQEPIFHELPLAPSFSLSIKIRNQMRLRILSNTYGKMQALVTKVTSFTASITQPRLCFAALRKTGINGILRMFASFR